MDYTITSCRICGRVPCSARCPNSGAYYLKCPACGAEGEIFYKNHKSEVIGCDRCIHKMDWWEIVVSS